MKSNMLLLKAGALCVLALATLSGAAQAEPAGPSQQVVTVAGSGDLTGTFMVQTGTTRFWVYRLDGDGVLSGRAVEGFRLLQGDEEDVLAFESSASNSAPIAESVQATVGVRHNSWGTTRLLLKTETGGKVSDENVGRDPHVAASLGLDWPIYSGGNGAVGGLGLSAVKPLGGPWVGRVEIDSHWEGVARDASSRSGSDWQAIRFGFALGQSRPFGTRWSLGGGIDFGQYGVGASRPLYAKFDVDRTALPGQPVELRARALGTFGLSGVSVGGNAGADFRLWGPVTIGLSADGNMIPGGKQHVAAGPSWGLNIPIGKETLRIRNGARLGVAKDASGVTGVVTPFLELGLERGN
ncbi:MAG: hypothetical protein AAB855_03115 [Patescibacteria group bacterium]